MDPEAVRNLVNACFERLVPVIERYGGTVDKFMGDCHHGAVWRAGRARERRRTRPARAALDIMDALAAFNAEQGTDLGIHLGHQHRAGHRRRRRHPRAARTYAVTGDAVNLAARLEDASRARQILVGPDTYRLTAPLFDFETLHADRA